MDVASNTLVKLKQELLDIHFTLSVIPSTACIQCRNMPNYKCQVTNGEKKNTVRLFREGAILDEKCKMQKSKILNSIYPHSFFFFFQFVPNNCTILDS